MKKIFYYAAMALAVSAVMVSCEKKNEDTPEPSKKVRLATPEVTATVDAENGVVTVEWGKVENAVSYAYKVDAGTETPSTELSFTLNVADLKAGDHTVEVKAIPAEDSEEYNESNWGSASFTIEENTDPVEPSEELKAWLGTYKASSTMKLEFTEGAEYIEIGKKEEPMEFTVTIEPSNNAELVLIYGLSGIQDIPALGGIVKDQKGNTGLGIITEQPFIDLGDGTSAPWLAIGEISGGSNDGAISYITGGVEVAYYFPTDASPLTSVASSGDLQNGGKFTIVAADAAMQSSQGIGLLYPSYPVYLPAGEITLEKQADAPAAVKRGGIPVMSFNNLVAKSVVVK